MREKVRMREVRTERRNENGRGRKDALRRSLIAGQACGSSGGAPSHPKMSGKRRGIKTRQRRKTWVRFLCLQ